MPTKQECHQAIKLLKQYARLAGKYHVQLPPPRLKSLDDKRDAGTITSDDLPARIRNAFPGSLRGRTLEDIEDLCKRL